MKKKFSDEMDENIQITGEYFHKLKQQKMRWIFPVLMMLPLFVPGLWIIGIIGLSVYLVCNSKDNNNQ